MNYLTTVHEDRNLRDVLSMLIQVHTHIFGKSPEYKVIVQVGVILVQKYNWYITIILCGKKKSKSGSPTDMNLDVRSKWVGEPD